MRKRKLQKSQFSMQIMLFLLVTTRIIASEVQPSRIRRQTQDNFSPLVENLQKLSRISNGISLEIGLIDETFPTDSVISELLHMGSLKPNQFVDSQLNSAKNAISEMSSLPKKWKTDDDVTAIESRLVVLENIRKESFSVEDFKNFTGRKDYETLLGEMKGLDAHKANINSLKTELVQLNGIFIGLENKAKDLNEQNIKSASLVFPSIVDSLGKVEKLVTTLDPLVVLLGKAKQLRESSKFFEMLRLESEFRKNLTNVLTYREDPMKSFNQNFDNVFDLGKTSATSEPAFSSIDQLILNRRDSRELPCEYRCGLGNGGIDLEKLKNDCGDEWIQKRMTNGSVVEKNLKESFSYLDELIGELKNVELAWKPLEDDKLLVRYEQVRVIQKEANHLSEISQVIKTKIGEFRACDKRSTGFPGVKFEDLKNVGDVIGELNTDLDQLRSLNYIEKLKNVTSMKDGLSTAGKPENEQIQMARTFMQKMESDEEYKNVIVSLKTLQTDLESMETIIPKVVDAVPKISFTYIDEHHEALNGSTAYLDTYTCLNKIGEDGNQVKKTIEFISRIKGLTEQEATGANKVIQSILDSQNGLKNSKEAAGKMKEVVAPEALNLKKSFPDSKEVSKKLGLAVRGMVDVKRMHDSRDKLAPLLKNSDELLIDAKSNNLAQSHLDSLQKLAFINTSLTATLAGIDEFLKILDGIERIRKRRNTGNNDFKGIGGILIAASKIPDVSDDMSGILEGIKELNTATSQKYGEEEKSVNTLKKLELQFSKFGLKDAPSSLEALDTFFLDYVGSMTFVPPSVAPSIAPSAPASSPSSEFFSTTTILTTTSAAMATWLMILISAIVLVCIACLIGGVCFCCRKKSAPDVLTPDVPDIPIQVPPVPTVPHPEEPSQPLVNPVEGNQRLPEDQQHQKRPDENLPPPAEENRNPNSVGSRNPTNQVEQQPPLQQKGDNPTDPSVSAEPEKAVQPLAQAIPKEVKQDQVAPIVAPVVDPSVPSTSKNPTGEQERQEELLPLDKTQRGGIEKLSLLYSVVALVKRRMIIPKMLPYDWFLIQLDPTYLGEKTNYDFSQYEKNYDERRVKAHVTHLDSMPVLEGFADPYINANFAQLGDFKYIATQHPLIGTIDKHFALLEQSGVGVLVHLNPADNIFKYFKTEEGGELTFGKYTVRTVGIKELPEYLQVLSGFKLYGLVLTNNETSHEHNFEILAYDRWTENNAPKNPAVGVGIIKYCDASMKNVMLQCYDGAGPSATLMAIKYGIMKSRTTELKNLGDFVREIRGIRYGALPVLAHLTYTVICISKALMDEEGIIWLEEYDRMYHHHVCMVDRSEHPKKWKIDPKAAFKEEPRRVPAAPGDIEEEERNIDSYCFVEKYKRFKRGIVKELTKDEHDRAKRMKLDQKKFKERKEEEPMAVGRKEVQKKQKSRNKSMDKSVSKSQKSAKTKKSNPTGKTETSKLRKVEKSKKSSGTGSRKDKKRGVRKGK